MDVEKLEESERKYRALFNHMTNAFAYHKMIFDEKNQPIDYVFLEVNNAFEKNTGLKREDIIGKKVTEVIPGIENAEPDLISIYGEVAKTGEGAHFELYFEPFDRWYSVSAHCPEKGYFVAVFDEITEQKAAEEKLQYFQRAVEGASDAIGMSTPEGRHYYQNEAFTRLFGLSVKEVDGKSGPPSTVYVDEKVGREIFATIMGGDSWIGEVEMLDKAGQRIAIFLRAYAIKDEKGKIVGLVGVHTDITERKKADESLKKREKQLSESQQVAKLGSWELNLVSQELEWSNETYKRFDKNPETFTPSFDEFARLVHPDDLETMQTNFNAALESDNNPYHVEIRIINDTGRKWVMEAFGKVERDKDGNPIKIKGTAQDVTERKKAEEKLHEKIEELEKWQRLTIDRELKMIDLKKEIKELKKNRPK